MDIDVNAAEELHENACGPVGLQTPLYTSNAVA